MVGDCLSIFDTLTVNPQDIYTEVERAWEIAREQHISVQEALQKITDERQSLENPEVAGLCRVVIALAFADDTIAALKRLSPDVAIQQAGSSQFRILAESADVARRILTERWETVTALATYLIEVKKMSGVELTAFLESRV